MSGPGRVRGHALQATPGPRGESVCQCGARSMATTVNAGRRWHREHRRHEQRLLDAAAARLSDGAATVRA